MAQEEQQVSAALLQQEHRERLARRQQTSPQAQLVVSLQLARQVSRALAV